MTENAPIPTPAEKGIDREVLDAAFNYVVEDFPAREGYLPLIQMGWMPGDPKSNGQTLHGVNAKTGQIEELGRERGHISEAEVPTLVPSTLWLVMQKAHEVAYDRWNLSKDHMFSMRHPDREELEKNGASAVIRGCGHTMVSIIGYGGPTRGGYITLFVPGENWSLEQVAGLAKETFGGDTFDAMTYNQPLQQFGEERRITPAEAGVPFKPGMKLEYQGAAHQAESEVEVDPVIDNGDKKEDEVPEIPIPSAPKAIGVVALAPKSTGEDVAPQSSTYTPRHGKSLTNKGTDIKTVEPVVVVPSGESSVSIEQDVAVTTERSAPGVSQAEPSSMYNAPVVETHLPRRGNLGHRVRPAEASLWVPAPREKY